MDIVNSSEYPKARVTRSSLACLPCRSRHLKCDGKRPCCSRCAEAFTQCQYAKSRRGGLDRATLAEKRKQRAAAEIIEPSILSPGWSLRLQNVPEDAQSRNSSNQTGQDSIAKDQRLVTQTQFFEDVSNLELPATPTIELACIENDTLIDLYYKNFHRFHPLVVPRQHLLKLYRDDSKRSRLTPLIALLRFIGNIYGSQEWSIPLKDYFEVCATQAAPNDPFTVQCRLLYSIVLFWHNYRAESKREMNNAVQLALELQMHREEFAAECADADAILAESWRRTWWMLYIIDAYYAGTLGTMNFTVVDIETTVELPCEESEYESGNIPQPRTLQDFDSREFDIADSSYSSFAYLIGAVKCAALAISTTPKVAAKDCSPRVVQEADSIIEAWLLLVPDDRKQPMSKNGEIDELMYQAYLVIHVAIVGLHRPLSDLKFNTVEHVSSCARAPPLENPMSELVNVHTVRVLRSVEAQVGLLALPSRPFNHTPFVTCMVSEGTLALLSACKYLLKDKELSVARDQIRMTIGCLRVLGKLWPRTARNLKEIQMIARHVIGMNTRESQSGSPRSSKMTSLSSSKEPTSFGSETDMSNDDVFSAIGAMDGVCGWYNFGNLDPQASWFADE